MNLLEFYKNLDFKSDKGTGHSYIENYYSLEFTDRTKPIKLLEIGIREGYSHYLWDKFFLNGAIYGVDNGDAGFDWEPLLEDTGVIHCKMDAYGNSFVRSLESDSFDYIIDDGSHNPTHQNACIDLFLPKLKSGGKLIIEDIGNLPLAYQLEARAARHKDTQSVKIHDFTSTLGRWDDILIEITKK